MDSLLAGVNPFHVLAEASLEVEVCPTSIRFILGRVGSERDGGSAVEEGQFSESRADCFWVD